MHIHDVLGHGGSAQTTQSKSSTNGNDITFENIIQQLTLDEKCTLLSGKNMWETASVERLGIKSLKMTDGPAGVRGAKWVDGSHTTYIPCGISLGATFDPALIEKVGTVLGQEARAKQAHVLLAPTMNISRSPFGGRNFENFGEDPLLTGTMATAYIRGIQSQGVGACMKHFVANDMETRRFNMDQTVDERTLREIYLKPFEMALKAKPWTAMTAYPKINGKHVDTSKNIVHNILRQEWEFDNLVMSDWGGLNDTVESIMATTDLEMPGPPIRYGRALAAAVRAGRVSEEEHVDPSVRRLLGLLAKAGVLKQRAEQPQLAANENLDRPEFRQIAREAAAGGIVLLKNSNNILPLKPSKIRKLAILGPNAMDTTHGGTGSAIVNPYYITNPLESIAKLAKEANPEIEIIHERGIYTQLQPPLMGDVLKNPNTGGTGFQVDFYRGFELQGDILETTNWQDSLVYLMSDGDRPADVELGQPFSYRAIGMLRPTQSGLYQFSLSNTGKAKLFVNDEVLIDNTEWTQISGNFMNCGSVEVFANRHLEAGKQYNIRVDNAVVPPPIQPHDNTLFHKISGVRVGLFLLPDEQAVYDAAIEAAKAADRVVVIVGHNNDTEREGSDRTSLHLPGRTNEFVSDVCAANPNNIVVTQSACAIAMPWSGEAAGIIHAWYQGQENGNALAGVLFGAVNPSGKLPLTFPKRIEDHGSFQWYPDAASDKVTYGEGVLVGYRWCDAQDIAPLWPFGFGLSYTTFQITGTKVEGSVSADGTTSAVVKAAVTNTGSVKGAEVVQIYVSASPAIAERDLQCAPRSLASFRKVHLAPGVSAAVELSLDASAIRWFDTGRDGWRVDTGAYKCYVGTSSRHIVEAIDFVVA
ncbi:putative glycosyl hydrolase [Byssothecium circinans]|uniref:beta-glucosidase n=1 Tax=Byssothecium circinans TaxID=147558 RepID=A0A6A5UIU4_9PLEO|nr:putative glycosyl hydrolase [Byssothecium circinans]